MNMRGRILVPPLALLFFGMAVFALHSADKARAVTKQEIMYLPSKTILSHFSVGMNSIIADFLWINCVQYTGRAFSTDHDFTWIGQMVDTATDLDPNFVELYRYGGIFLASLQGDGDAAIELLEKGIRQNPESWELPYEIAMVYMLNRGEDPNSKCNAQYYVAMSLATGNAPEFVQEVYEGLKDQCEAHSSNPCDDLEFEAQTYRRLYETGEEMMQGLAEEKMAKLQLRKNCCDLMVLLEEYRAKTGATNATLEDLTASGALAQMPDDPYGGTYFIDADGLVKNTTVLDEEVEKLKARMQGVINKYHEKNAAYPPSLEEMLANKFLTFLPPHPYATRDWRYDPQTGTLE